MAATLIETASAAAAAATNTITVTLASPPNSGDKLIAFVHHTDDFPATPSGWTQEKEVVTNGVLSALSKTSDGSEGTDFTFTAPSSGGMTARVLRCSGVGAINASASGYGSDTTSFTSGNLTTTEADTFLIGGAGLHATTLPSGDVTQGSGFTAVAADVKSTNSTSRKSQLTVGTRLAATAGAYAFTGTYTAGSATSIEPILLAWSVTDPDGSVTAVVATGSGVARVPAVAGSATGSVTAVKATGAGVMEAPAVQVTTTVSGGGAMAGSGLMPAPTVTASGSVTASAVKAAGTGAMVAPTASGSSAVNGSVAAAKATGTGTARSPGVQVVETLPTNIGTGRITGRFGRAEVMVGDNDGIPNLYPITDETITFTSTAGVLLNATASPAVVILPQPIVCTIDSQGYLVDSAGHQWVDLIATDDADLAPTSRKWRVTFSAGLGISSFEMTVIGGTTVDLTGKIPL
jgi:hypothetical protein